MSKYKTILEVYQDIFANIRYWEDEAKKADTTARRELCETVAHELTHAAADLENTREVNPPQAVKIEGNPRVKVFHLLIADTIGIDEADELVKSITKTHADAILKSEYHATRELIN